MIARLLALSLLLVCAACSDSNDSTSTGGPGGPGPGAGTGSLTVLATDDEQKLRAGMLAKLSITTATHSNALMVPRSALLGLGGKDAATMVIESGNRVRRAPVQLGLVNDQYVEVLGGLTEGQLVVTGGLSTVTEGDLVAPQLSTQTAFAR